MNGHRLSGESQAAKPPPPPPHTLSPDTHTGLFREIEARASSRPEYRRLLDECQGLYCASRLALISPFVQQRVGALAAQALPLLARNGCEHLLRVRGERGKSGGAGAARTQWIRARAQGL